MNLEKVIRDVPDFPEKGILFRDITPLLHSPDALIEAVDKMSDKIKDLEFDFIAGPESRGFIFGVPLAYNMKKGFIPVRKKGKLPHETIQKTYDLEYGTATIEIHKDAIVSGSKIVIIDDLLATGGTCRALVELIEEAGAEVAGIVFLIELEGLKGRELFKQYNVHSILQY